MAGSSSAALVKAALDRKACIFEIEKRDHSAEIVLRQQLRVRTGQQHGVAATAVGIALRVGVEQVHNAALAYHRIEIEFLFKPFPEFHRKLIEWLVSGQQIV